MQNFLAWGSAGEFARSAPIKGTNRAVCSSSSVLRPSRSPATLGPGWPTASPSLCLPFSPCTLDQHSHKPVQAVGGGPSATVLPTGDRSPAAAAAAAADFLPIPHICRRPCCPAGPATHLNHDTTAMVWLEAHAVPCR